MNKKTILKTALSIFFFFILSGCNNEDYMDTSSKVKNIVTTRTSSEWGTVRCVISGKVATISWHYPTGEENVGMLFELWSSTYGILYRFETQESEGIGDESFQLPHDYKHGTGEILFLEVRASHLLIPVYVELESTGGGEYSGESTKRCNHKFNNDYHSYMMNLTADLSSGIINGSIGLANTKKCRFIMKYSYYDRIERKSYEEYLVKDITPLHNDASKIYWDNSRNIPYMSDIDCEVRLYDLSCDKGIPTTEFIYGENMCGNYLQVKFTIPAGSYSFTFPPSLAEVKH